MNTVRVILTLITIGCIVGPIGAVLIMYHNNLSQVIISPSVQQLFPNNNGNNNNNNGNNNNGNNNNNNNGNNNNNNGNNNGGNSNNNQGGVSPAYNSGEINIAQKTITLTFSLSNTLSKSTTISAMMAVIEITQDQSQLGKVNLQNPVTISPGQTVTVTVSGPLIQSGLDDLSSHYGGVSYLDITALNGQMTEDGVTNQASQTQDLGVAVITR